MLGSHPLFGALAPEIRDKLGVCAKTRNVPRGSIIFSKGDAGTSLFTVCSGTVQVIVPSVDGKSAVFNFIGDGDVFGEIALLDGRPRTADAVAFTDCKLMTIDRRDFIPLLRGRPEVAIKLIEVLCGRLRQTTEQVQDLMFLDLKGRLVKSLLRLSQKETSGRISISQNDLSQIVGMSREMINKQLQVWANNHWILLERKRITVLRPDALARIVADE
ncbi:MAG: family transcriptional regulator, cyclic receptor protein [Bradyrhizobium sp.]|jgi:CRP-like cAMP-binding protein|nr:family transcriptional regulator, cyclic receptor protein [Bradyrhizobium sp.]